MYNSYSNPFVVSQAQPNERAQFIRRTYSHLAGAILAFIGIETFLLNLPGIEKLVYTMMGGQMSWIIVLAMFMGVSFIADKWARSSQSRAMQYSGLMLYVFAEAIIFVPLLYIARSYAPDVIPQAGVITLLLFTGLTATVFITRKDFSFLKGFITMAMFVAIGVIIASLLFGFTLGTLFSALMCFVASASILYTTSNIMNHYRTDQDVSAALALFASVALLFWYILRILLSFANND